MRRGETMEAKKKYKFNPFMLQDLFYEQIWLEDLAKKGFLLIENGSLLFKFVVNEPTNRRYRILPYRQGKIPDEEKLLYESCGWKIIYGSLYSTIFYSDDSDAPEPFSDVLSKNQYYMNWLIHTLIQFIVAICLIAYINRRLFLGFLTPSETVYSLADQNMIIIVLNLLVIPFVIFALATTIAKYLNFFCRLRSEKAVTIKGYKGVYRFNIFYYTLVFAIAVACIIVPPVSFESDSSSDNIKYLKYRNKEMVRYSEFAPTEWQVIRDAILKHEDTNIIYSFKETHSALIPRISYESLSISDEPEDELADKTDDKIDTKTASPDSISYDIYLYKARNANVAKHFMAHDMVNQVEGFGTTLSKRDKRTMQFNYKGLDYAAYFKSSGELQMQFLFLRKDNKYEAIIYSGPVDLRAKVDLFASKLL